MNCPKCQGRATKAGKGWYKGKKVQLLRCQTCGHVFREQNK
jgi:Zn ribbon nucleic-acid-binding protein